MGVVCHAHDHKLPSRETPPRSRRMCCTPRTTDFQALRGDPRARALVGPQRIQQASPKDGDLGREWSLSSGSRQFLHERSFPMNVPTTSFLVLASLGVLLAADVPGLVSADASSGASCKITGGTALTTTATVQFNEGHSNDILWCFWGEGVVTTASPNKIKVTDRGRPGSVEIRGLKAGTRYSVLLKGEGHGVSLTSTRYMAKGHFTTTASATGVQDRAQASSRADGRAWDARGRSIAGRSSAGWQGAPDGGSVGP